MPAAEAHRAQTIKWERSNHNKRHKVRNVPLSYSQTLAARLAFTLKLQRDPVVCSPVRFVILHI